MANKPLFIDANIPMYADGAPHAHKAPCIAALAQIADGALPAITSAEVLQELLHRFVAVRQPERAAQVVADFVTLVPGVLPITKEDVLRAAQLASEHRSLPARDLLHLAVMLNHNLDTILSVDTPFDGVPNIKRIDPKAV